jgi:DNA-binding NarL/FixJ family response regulator
MAAANDKVATVLVVDDHPIVRQGLEGVLRSTDELKFLGAVESGAQALEAVGRSRIDVVLLDLRLAENDGLVLLAELLKLAPAPRVIIFSSHEGDAMITRALRAGASGYVSKNAPPTEILTAIRSALRGESYISTALRRKLGALNGAPSITEREQEVLEQVALGLSNQEIADRLGCAE